MSGGPQRTFYTVLGWATWRAARLYVRRRVLPGRDGTGRRRLVRIALLVAAAVAAVATLRRGRAAEDEPFSFPVPSTADVTGVAATAGATDAGRVTAADDDAGTLPDAGGDADRADDGGDADDEAATDDASATDGDDATDDDAAAR
ncbi:MAG: hypothetical protein M0P31_07640 [Solirubrobacteraceae bacterium]|nr:hypothetical protein [Solirubrobacteraceae bacterium]